MTQPSAMLSDALGALLVRGLGIGLMFASTTIAARTLGAAEYGTFSSAMSLSMLLATLAPMGTDRVVSRNLATSENHAESVWEISQTLASTLTGAAVLLLFLLANAWISRIFPNLREWTQVLMLSAGLFIPMSLMYVRQWIALPLVGIRRALVPEQTLLPLAFSISLLSCAGLQIPVNASTTSLLYLAAMVLVLATTSRSRAMRPLLSSALVQLRMVPPATVRRRIPEGLPFVLISIGAVACQASIPMTLAATIGFRETACFMLAIPYAALPSLPLGILNLSLLPQLRRHFLNGEMPRARHCVRSAATWTFAAATILSAMIWSSAPLIITILGQDYVAVAGLLLPLLLAAMVDCLTGPTVPVMQTMGLEAFYTRAMLCFLPVQIVLIAAAGTLWGIQGSAFAFLAARVLWNIVIGVHIYRTRAVCMLPYLNIVHAFRDFAEPAADELLTGVAASDRGFDSIPCHSITRAAS